MKDTIKNGIQEYLNAVTGEMTFSEAREGAKLEILDHLQEQIKVAQSYGLSTENAIQDSIRRMGNPIAIGKSLNRIHQPKFNFVLPFLAIALSSIGIWNLAGTKWMGLQILWLVVGLAIMTSLYFLPIRWFKNSVSSLYALAVAGLFVSHLSGVIADGQPYLSFGSVNIKIVDLAGCLFALGFAGLSVHISKSRWRPFLLFGLFLGPVAYFSFNGFIWPGMLFWVSGMCLLGLQDISTLSLTGTGILSSGMLASRFSESFVPIGEVNKAIVDNARTDYALHSMREAIGAEILTGILFISVLTYGLRLAFEIKDKNLRSIAIVGMAFSAVQIFMSVLANIGVVPMASAGVSVPFISYGGSGVIAHFLIFGILIACHKRKQVSPITG